MTLRLLTVLLVFTTLPVFAQTVKQVTADTVIGFGTLRAASPSPNGKHLLTGGGAGIMLWDTATWQSKRFRLPEGANTWSLAWDARGQRVVSLNNGAVHLWDANTQKLLKRYEQEFFTDTVRLNPSGNALAYVQGFRQKWVKVYNPRSSAPPVFEMSILSFLRREPEPLQPGAVHSYGLAGDSVLHLEFTSDTNLLSVSDQGVVQEADFDPAARKVGLGTRSEVRLPVNGRLQDVAFDQTYKQVATLAGDTLTVWSYPEMQKLASRAQKDLSGVAFSRDGGTLVVVDSSGNGFRWQHQTGQTDYFGVRDPYYHAPYQVMLSGAREDILVYGELGTLDVYDGSTLEAVRTPLGGYAEQVFNFRLAPDEKSLIVEAQTGIEKRYRLPEGTLIETVVKPKGGGCSLGSYYYTADRRFTAVVPSDVARQLTLYRGDTCVIAATLTGVEEPIGGLVVSANERYALLVAFGSADVWSLETGRKLFSPKLLTSVPGRVEKVPAHLEGGVFSPDERRLTVLFGESAVTYDLLTRRRLNAVSFSRWGRERLDGLALSPDGKRLAGSSVGDIIVWDYPAGPLRYELSGHTDTVHAMTFLRDGKRLVTGSSDGTVRLWSVP